MSRGAGSRRLGRAARVAGVLSLVVCLFLGGADAAARWGWLGVRIRDLSEQEMNDISRRHGLREGFGVLIVEVMKETPAETSGLRNGDLVVGFRDRPVVDTRTLQRLISRAGVGETVQLTVLRGDEGRRGVAVRLAPMPEPVAAERVAAEFGFLVRQADSQSELGGRRPAALPSAAPSVVAVFQGGRADRAGLKVGDVLVEVNGRPVTSLDAAQAALLDVPVEGALPLVVRRDEDRLPVVVAPVR